LETWGAIFVLDTKGGGESVIPGVSLHIQSQDKVGRIRERKLERREKERGS